MGARQRRQLRAMTAAVADAAATDVMPKDGSLYFDYLRQFPVGVSMSCDLQPDAAALSPHEGGQMVFVIKKVGADSWEGLPGYETESGVISTCTLFDHVLEQMEDEDFILVTHGRDPRRVKQEMIERGEEPEEEEITFFSMSQAINLVTDSEDEGDQAAAAAESKPKGRARYESVRLSLARPSALPALAEAPVPAEAPTLAGEPQAGAPASAEAPQYPFPEVGSYVTVDGDAGFVFKASSKMWCIAYSDETWEACGANIPWEASSEADQCAIAAVIWVLQGKLLLVESYLYRRSNFGAWTVFDEHQHPRVPFDRNVLVKPRLPVLKVGQRVDCLAKVWSGSGSTCTSGAGVTLVAIAQQWTKGEKPQLRRYAVVSLPDGELTWADLMGPEEGYLKHTEPAAAASGDELDALKAKLPAFLATRNVSSVNSLFTRLIADGGPQLRPRREPAPAAYPTAAESPPVPKPDAPAPSLPHDLKNVTVSRLRGLSDVQLRKLCEERALPLVADAGGPQMLTALLQFRAKQGRSSRAAGSSGGLGGGGSSGGGGGSGDGLGSDDEQSRQWEEDRRREREEEEARERDREREKKKERQEKEREKREKRKEEKRKKRKKRKKRARSPSPSSGSDSDSSGSSSHQHKRRSPSSSCSTPWDVVKAREERDAIEAVRFARLTAKIDRHERKQHERKRHK